MLSGACSLADTHKVLQNNVRADLDFLFGLYVSYSTYRIYLLYVTVDYLLCGYSQGVISKTKTLENHDEFRKIEYALKEWIAQKRYCEYEQSREEIAKELNTTKENLHHYFLSRKGMDFNAWRTELRIEEAKKMLIENMDFPINIIGELAGFSDRSNFHRQFVKSVGCSPKRWRESHGKP